MRILFHTNGLGKLRHFPSVTCELAERGHDVTIVLEGPAVRERLRLCRCHDPFPIISGPEPRTDAWAPHGRELRESAGSLTGQRNHPWQSGDSTSGQEKRRRASIASCRMLARCRFSARKREQSTRSPSVTNVPGKCWRESLIP